MNGEPPRGAWRDHETWVRKGRQVVRSLPPTMRNIVTSWFNSPGGLTRRKVSGLPSGVDFDSVLPKWITAKSQKQTSNRRSKTGSATHTSARAGEDRVVGGDRDLGARLR